MRGIAVDRRPWWRPGPRDPSSGGLTSLVVGGSSARAAQGSRVPSGRGDRRRCGHALRLWPRTGLCAVEGPSGPVAKPRDGSLPSADNVYYVRYPIRCLRLRQVISPGCRQASRHILKAIVRTETLVARVPGLPRFCAGHRPLMYIRTRGSPNWAATGTGGPNGLPDTYPARVLPMPRPRLRIRAERSMRSTPTSCTSWSNYQRPTATAPGFGVILKRVGKSHGIPKAELLPLPRLTRGERESRSSARWVAEQ